MKPRWMPALFCLGLLQNCLASSAQPPSTPTITPPPSAGPIIVDPAYSTAQHPTYIFSRHTTLGYNSDNPYWIVTIQPGSEKYGPRAPWGVFKSLAAPELRQWVSRLPAGSIILLPQINHRHMSGAFPSLTPLQIEVDDFRQFCVGGKLEAPMLIEQYF